MWGWGCTFSVSPTAILFSAVESEQLVVAIDLLHAVTLPSTTLCASFYVCEVAFFHMCAGIFIFMFACAFHVFYICVNVYTHCMFECTSVWRSACFSFSENSPWGDARSSNKKFFFLFFPSRSVTVDSYPPHGPARGLPAWGGALPAEGEGENGIWQRLCVLVGVRVCVWRTSAKATPGANGLEKFSHCLHPLFPSPHALADVGRNYWTPWLPFLPTAAFDLFHVGQIFFPTRCTFVSSSLSFLCRSFSPSWAPFDGDSLSSLIHKENFLSRHPPFCFKVGSFLLTTTLNLILFFSSCLLVYFVFFMVLMTLIKGIVLFFFFFFPALSLC